MGTIRPAAALWTVLSCLTIYSVSGSYPQVQNVTWKSTNFKTILTWESTPSADYAYTVEFSMAGGDKQTNPHCIQSPASVCDLSGSLTELHTCYRADVLTTPPTGHTSDLTELPYSTSPPFCPYTDTDIGRPDFKLKVSEDQKRTTLYVDDPLTALFKEDRQLNIRDVFSEQLQYKVTYRRNKSTGKKVHYSKSNVIELSDLDQGESYCFSVQALITKGRSQDKQLGELSHTQCSNDEHTSIFKVYSVGVIAAGAFLVLLLIGLLVAVTVVCIKRRKRSLQKQSEKEGVPLRDERNV